MRIIVAVIAMFATKPAWACPDQQHLNALEDQARAAEKQAESLGQLERIERDRLRLLDRQQRNADR